MPITLPDTVLVCDLLKHQPANNDSGDRTVGCWGCDWTPSYQLEAAGASSWEQFVEHVALLYREAK